MWIADQLPVICREKWRVVLVPHLLLPENMGQKGAKVVMITAAPQHI